MFTSAYSARSEMRVVNDPAPRGKRYDYFCGALPWPQKGEAVDLPLGGTAPVTLSSDGEMKFSFGPYTNAAHAGTLYGTSTIYTKR